MEQDTEVVTRIQGSPISPHQRGNGTHINPLGGSLQVAPTGGRTNPITGAAGKYHGQASRRRRYCSDSAKTLGGTGGRTIGHEGREPEDMATGYNQVERPRHREVGQIGEYNAGSVLGRIHPGGMSSGSLPSCPMVLPPVPSVVSALPLQYPQPCGRISTGGAHYRDN